MPTATANGITLHYEIQGAGPALVLVPYLAADNACYAFQVAEYAKHFTCISVDPRGAGLSDKPEGDWTTELFADDIAALIQVLGLGPAHIFGLSLGAATGLWLAAKYPQLVRTLSLHSGWAKSDAYLAAVVGGWQAMAKALGVPEMVIQGIFPWCFTPALYEQPETIKGLADFVRSRPVQPLDAFLRQSAAVIGHDASAAPGLITAPTQITYGRHDAVTSTRFAPALRAIAGSEFHVFEHCAHAPIYEDVAGFNALTLNFLKRHDKAGAA